MQRRGFMLMLSSPSGAGKTTLSRRLLAQHPNVCFSVSVTTRPMRSGEVDGTDYRFVTEEAFAQMQGDGELLESSQIYGHYYGTPQSAVDPHLAQGKDVLFEIDWHGYRQLAANCPDDVVSIFILPPSLDELQRRLKQRGQDSAEVIERRLQQAEQELQRCVDYDYVIVNHDLDEAQAKIVHIIEAERQRRARLLGLEGFVIGLG